MYQHVHHEIPPARFYIQPITVGHVVALNMLALWSVGSFANKQ